MTPLNLDRLSRWALFDRDTQRLIQRASSLDKLRPLAGLLARCGVACDYRREVARQRHA